MNNPWIKKILPHLAAIVICFLVIAVYFSPMLGGKVLKQHDVLQWKASYNEIAEFEKAHPGERTFWTNSMFGGMPGYLIGSSFRNNFTYQVSFRISEIMRNPVDTLFLLFICF